MAACASGQHCDNLIESGVVSVQGLGVHQEDVALWISGHFHDSFLETLLHHQVRVPATDASVVAISCGLIGVGSPLNDSGNGFFTLARHISWDFPLSGCRDAARDDASHGARRRGARGQHCALCQHCGDVTQLDGSQVMRKHHQVLGMTTSELDWLQLGVVDPQPSRSRRLHRTRRTPQPRSGVLMVGFPTARARNRPTKVSAVSGDIVCASGRLLCFIHMWYLDSGSRPAGLLRSSRRFRPQRVFQAARTALPVSPPCTVKHTEESSVYHSCVIERRFRIRMAPRVRKHPSECPCAHRDLPSLTWSSPRKDFNRLMHTLSVFRAVETPRTRCCHWRGTPSRSRR